MQAELDVLQERELAIAAADQECTGDTDPIDAIFEEYMRSFIEENASELAEFTS